MKMEELLPSNIDGVFVSISDSGKRQTLLPINMTGESYNKWKKGRGGIFHHDVFLWTNKKEHGKYLFMESGEEQIIIRLIDDNELDDFGSRKLIQGKIKDKPYMIFKNLCKVEELKGSNGYIDEIEPEELFEEEDMEQIILNIPLEEDEDHSSKSMSLFDD
jgi:hypothetical protein